MKKLAIWTLLALTIAACGGKSGAGTKADELIDAAYRAKNYHLLLSLADSMQQTGQLSDVKAYYWQGYASDRLMLYRTAEFYWKSAIAAAENSTDAEDLALYAKSASRLANVLSVRGDYESTLKAAEPVVKRLETLGCDTTSDYTNLLIFVGCCKTRFGLPDSTANRYYDQALDMHEDFINRNHSDEAYKNAIAGVINIAYNCNGTSHYEDALRWTDRFGKLISEYEMRQGQNTDYIDKQWARYDIYRAIALEGLQRHEEADSVYRDYLRTQFAQTPEGHIYGADYLIAANRWAEAADAYRSLDDMVRSQAMTLSLENIQKLGLRKYRINEQAGRRDSANAVASGICSMLDSAIILSQRLAAQEQQTIRDKETQMMAQQAEVTRMRMLMTLVLLFFLLAAFIGYVLYQRRLLHRMLSAHEELKSSLGQREEDATTKERVENRQRIARNVQMKMMPDTIPESRDVSLYAMLMHGSDTNGDLYDYFIRDNKLFFCIGEANPKGVSAAVTMAMVKAVFNSVTNYESRPERIMATMNEVGAENSGETARLMVGVLDLATGRLKYSNAGHTAPLLVGSGIGLLPVDVNGVLGERKDTVFTVQEALIDPGTVIFLYNDGLTALEDVNQQPFGQKRMMGEALQTLHGLNPEPKAFTERMMDAINKFRGEAEIREDVMMLTIRYMHRAEGVSYQRSVNLTNETTEVLRLNSFMEKVCNDLHLSKTVGDEISQTMEAAMVNVLKYGYADGVKGNILVEARVDTTSLRFVMRDQGQAFDAVTSLPEHSMDAISYELVDGHNVLTLMKNVI
mgnify:CR=1 FL=1